MKQIVRVTKPTLKLLEYVSSLNGDSTWGFEIVRATGLKTGTVYPILDRLESMAWLESYWEEDSVRTGPRRKLYRLNPAKKTEIFDLLASKAGQQAKYIAAQEQGLAQST